MESKGTFFILIIVIAVLTLTLAALAGYIFLVQGTPGTRTADTRADVEKVVPKDAELETLELYEGKKYFNLKNEDPKKIAIIQVNVGLKYFIEIKDNKKLKVLEKIESNIMEIREIISSYFLHVSLEDVKLIDAKEKAKTELKKQINELLNEGEKEVHEYVYRVIIDEWLFQ
ncbi:MAG: flagellar basal body-associated protein FliL [Ruminiclostridium sp.]|nr:flagellar basal body-associated protein FliL [Ruminiclostridium sp.]